MFLLQALKSSTISARNELAVYDNLQNACCRKLETFPTTYVQYVDVESGFCLDNYICRLYG